jgi:hypothetical protein
VLTILHPFPTKRKETKVEYSSKHEDSMEIQLVKLVQALAKKARDVKRSYGKRIQ